MRRYAVVTQDRDGDYHDFTVDAPDTGTAWAQAEAHARAADQRVEDVVACYTDELRAGIEKSADSLLEEAEIMLHEKVANGYDELSEILSRVKEARNARQMITRWSENEVNYPNGGPA